MRLQADPDRGLRAWAWRRASRLYLRQLRVDSPFNTYLVRGPAARADLQPGPRAASRRCIDPTPGVARPLLRRARRGRHLFAETYEEHLANIRTVRERPSGGAQRRTARPP